MLQIRPSIFGIQRISFKSMRLVSFPFVRKYARTSVVEDSETISLLLEDGRNLLLEDGNEILIKTDNDMADTNNGLKISQLDPLSKLTGKEEIPVALNGKNYKVSIEQIWQEAPTIENEEIDSLFV